MKKLLLLGSIGLIYALSSCGLLGKARHGELTRRYESKNETTIDTIQHYVSVEGYAFLPEKPAPSKPKSFYDLNMEVQRELVRSYTKKDTTSAALIRSISTPLGLVRPDQTGNNIDDRTTFSKRLVFSIRNKSYSPADRIWKIYIRLTKPPGNIRFSSSSALATDFESVDIGKLSFSRKSSFSSSLNAGTGVSATETGKNSSTTTDNSESKDDKTGANNTSTATANRESTSNRTAENKIAGTIGYTSEFSSNEEVALKQRYVKLSASVNSNRLSLYQESTSGIDLSGNIVADVEFGYEAAAVPNNLINQTVFEFNNLKSGSIYNNPGALTVKPFTVIYPDVPHDIYGTIGFEAVVRKVNLKDNTIAESDDQVTFIGGTFSPVPGQAETVLLLSHREITPYFWHVLNSSGNPIKVRAPVMPSPIDLIFRSFEDAKNFVEWIKQKRQAVVNAGLTVGGLTLLPGTGIAALSEPEINALSVHIIAN